MRQRRQAQGAAGEALSAPQRARSAAADLPPEQQLPDRVRRGGLRAEGRAQVCDERGPWQAAPRARALQRGELPRRRSTERRGGAVHALLMQLDLRQRRGQAEAAAA
jgi:hypothetical protein